MIKTAKCVVLIVGLWLQHVAFGQHSNSWISTSQLYFKIPVAQDGVYHLKYSDLLAAGFPVTSVDPRTIQLFHRGQEQALYIKGQADGVFNSTDFIEFYGKKNDGTLDSSLYRPYTLQPHRYYNLYSDTTAFFLTYNVLNRGIRIDSLNKIVNVAGLPAEGYQYAQRLSILHDQYSAGLTKQNEFQSTFFDQGEGWTGVALQQGQSVDYLIDSVFNGVISAGVPKLEMLLVGRDFQAHSLQILVGASLRQIAAPNFIGFDTLMIKSDLQWSDVDASGKILIRIVAAANTTTNRYQASASYIKVTFPQSFNWSGVKQRTLTLEKKPGDVSYLSFSNPPSGMSLWDVTDPAKPTRVIPATNPFNAIVTGTSVTRKFYSFTSVLTPSVVPVSFQDFSNFNADYLIITNKVLRKPGGGYADPVQAYADYRASSDGGSYAPLIVTIDQLYNQFNYGEVSPLGIYNFMSYLATRNIKYLFLIGKGRDITCSAYQRVAFQPGELNDLVPSAGYPGGDIAYTAYINGTNYYPSIPTGRLTASSPDEVANYLKKVIQIEKQSVQPWQKQILHLSGGGSSTSDAYELNLFRSYCDQFKAIAEAPYLGGNVITEAKVNVGVEQINVAPVVNQGVNLVTFFGHSSSETIDIDIGFVEDPTLGYSNGGKYPVFLINGCNAGTVFSNQTTFGENWMLAAGKGSRNFIAGTSFGLANYLRDYTKRFYEVGFGDSTFIKLGIGDIQKEACRRYLDSAGTGFFQINLVQQMVLAGDPALKLFGTTLPDYGIDKGALSLASLDGKPVTSLSDSFAIKIIVKNSGAYSPKKMKVRVIRQVNNTTKSYDSTYAPVLNIDTLIFKLRKDKTIDGFGPNEFTVIIDPLHAIKELNNDVANNTAILDAFIPSNGTVNLFPPAYGIVNTTSLNLVFQDANGLGAQRKFLVQVDTVATFNSPFAMKRTVSGKVLAMLPINLVSGDSTVYYWRTKPDKQNATDSSYWTSSSFIYISNGTEGWAQTKFSQLINDALINLTPNSNDRLFDFTVTTKEVQVKSIGENSSSSYTSASIKIGGVEYNINAQQEGVNCRNNTINVIAFNKQTAAPYPGISVYLNDPRGCGLQPSVINSFLSTELEVADGINLLNTIDGIATSDSVVLYTVGNPTFSTWSTTVLNKLNDLGIDNSQITSLQDGEPVVILAKKGSAIGSAKIIRTSQVPATSQDLAVGFTITGKATSGKINSVVIGPAKKWISFSSRSKKINSTNNIMYSVYGLSLSGTETLLKENLSQSTDLSFIDASVYPQLRLRFNVSDSINQTAAQLKNWFVIYESVAEGLLYFNGSSENQTIQEGQGFSTQFGFVNLSTKSFADSLQVNLDIKNSSKGSASNRIFKIKQPSPGDTTKFSVDIDSRGKSGLNDISVYVNPKIQPEMYYENNVIGLDGYLNVLADRTPPLLDVTVDGRYLQNGDFVSPSPTILAKLHDDNPFLLIADTTHLNLFLSYPCDNPPCAFQRINFSRSDVHWIPASANSDFNVGFHPSNLQAGNYSLQVNANDESGNSSGQQPYQVTFQVANETSLGLNSVHPNPSKAIFNFSFQLAGNELPQDFSLQIFSDEGQLLNQFNRNDISGFVIGTNTISWDASQATNGLLIYRMSITVNRKTSTQTGRLILVK
jgi:hypothetical protein